MINRVYAAKLTSKEIKKAGETTFEDIGVNEQKTPMLAGYLVLYKLFN